MNPELRLAFLREVLALTEAHARKIQAASADLQTGYRQLLEKCLSVAEAPSPEPLVDADLS